METLFASIDYRDPIWIAVAFGGGMLASLVGLPPLVGFLVAGFALNGLGAESGSFLQEMADLGVTLLLFSIGLKLRIRQLAGREIWGVAVLHLALVTLSAAGLLMLLGRFGLPLFDALDWQTALLIGFALSFSSTVFAVKQLEERDDMAAWYGRLAIGILIMQDVAAVAFLGVSADKVPSPLAGVVILIVLLARPLLWRLLDRVGHGELQVLFGLALALGGATLFELVDLKGDLGALAFGVLLAGHPKASELFKALLSLKDLFLVGFFLSIGMAGTPDATTLLVALVLMAVVPLKTALYFLLLVRFRVRLRAAVLSSQTLANFSEFGLIVASLAAAKGWLATDWVVVLAIAVALSFVTASILSTRTDRVYLALRDRLRRFERHERLAGDESLHLDGARVVVFGMGRIGTGAYDALSEQWPDTIVGVDLGAEVAARHRELGRDVRWGNATSPEFWSRIDRTAWDVNWILLAMPNQRANLAAARLARQWGFEGLIGASAKFSDEADELRQNGVNAVFNIYAEAGRGFADHATTLFSGQAGRDLLDGRE